MTEAGKKKSLVAPKILINVFFLIQTLIRLELAACCPVCCWIYVLRVTSFCIDVTTLTEGFAGKSAESAHLVQVLLRGGQMGKKNC